MRTRVLDVIGGWEMKRESIIRLDYSPYALNQVRLIQKNGINDTAIKRDFYEGISIDGIESLDLDDAIWAERTQTGYVVWIHISDVTEAIPLYSPLDIEAMRRTTSIYRAEGVLNMLPEELSQKILSLNENGEKLTLTMRVELDLDTQIQDFDVSESTFRNLKRYDYENFIDDYLEPESQHHNVLHLMYEIAQRRKTQRIIGGADMKYDESDRKLFIWEKAHKEHARNKSIASTIIQEFMILANICAAMLVVKKQYNGIFRCQRNVDEKAYYSAYCTPHRSLALPQYTHFTSPIRRICDMVLHRVLKQVHIRWEESPYVNGEIADIAGHINVSRTLIEIVGRELDFEIRGRDYVSKIKQRLWWEISVSSLTQNIRDTVGNGRKLPKAVVDEVIKDLEHWEKSNWAWAIGVILVSKEYDLKRYLKKALLDDRKFRPKAVLSILNVTKILSSDSGFLFHIDEITLTQGYHIEVKYLWETLVSDEINCDEPFQERECLGILRTRVLYQIVQYFCGEDEEK